MKQIPSSRKTNEIARERIAQILLTQVSDPRLAMVTVTGCEVAIDRSVCNVYISADRASYDEVEAGNPPRGVSVISWARAWTGGSPRSSVS